MNDRLDCEIVRDLLPSYVDDLASDATRRAVEAHLADCGDCTAALRRMKEPEPPQAPPAEVDYLKKVRRRTTRRALLIAIALMLAGMSLLLFRLFYIGSEAGATEAVCRVSVEDGVVSVQGALTSSGLAVSRVRFSYDAGIVGFRVYTVPVAFFNSGDFQERYTVDGPVTQVRMGERIVWEEGVEIGSMASRLFAAANPYVGDMPANSAIASILGVSGQFGPYTSELQTAAEPYGWTLILENDIAPAQESAARELMAADSCAMLAVIGNLGSVTWRYATEGAQRAYTVTEADAAAYTGRDVKQAAATASGLQALLQSLSLRWAAVLEPLQADAVLLVSVRNRCDDEIYGLSLDYYLDGALIGSLGQSNADGSALAAGEARRFTLVREDFPDGGAGLQLTGLSIDLSVLHRDGSRTVVCEGLTPPAEYSSTLFYTLAGNHTDGFRLSED